MAKQQPLLQKLQEEHHLIPSNGSPPLLPCLPLLNHLLSPGSPIPSLPFFDISSNNLTLLCDGTGLHTNVSSHGGYCVLASNQSVDVSLSCNSANCLSLEMVIINNYY